MEEEETDFQLKKKIHIVAQKKKSLWTSDKSDWLHREQPSDHVSLR